MQGQQHESVRGILWLRRLDEERWGRVRRAISCEECTPCEIMPRLWVWSSGKGPFRHVGWASINAANKYDLVNVNSESENHFQILVHSDAKAVQNRCEISPKTCHRSFCSGFNRHVGRSGFWMLKGIKKTKIRACAPLWDIFWGTFWVSWELDSGLRTVQKTSGKALATPLLVKSIFKGCT